MRKGDLVRLNVDTCFTKKNDGKLTWPLSNRHNDDLGIVRGFYKLTYEQQQDWYKRLRDDVAAGRDVGYDSAGESKLAPKEGSYRVMKGEIYYVVRARAQATSNYRKVGGLTKILDTKTGREVYIKRDLLEVIAEAR